jgi:hypothetical protein
MTTINETTEHNPFAHDSTADVLTMIEREAVSIEQQVCGLLNFAAHAVIRGVREVQRRVLEQETAVHGYCTLCREAQTKCDEDLCCLSCGTDLAPVADHGADVLTEAFGELDQRIAALEADAARLRIRAEAREAQLRHAQARLNRLGHGAADVDSVCSGLEASGAATVANWWDGFGDAEAIIIVTPGREAEVDAAMLAIAFYPSGSGSPKVGEGVRYYSTDGTPPWEAP